MSLGLRIDVDTHDGMRDGVPAILKTLSKYKFNGTFFFSFGPDNSGKAIFRAFSKPGFVGKMMRTNGAAMYGMRTALSGTLLRARPIANAFPDVARECKKSGHEVGVHAWDHAAWQDHLHEWDINKTRGEFTSAVDAFVKIFAEPPKCSAAPAWYASPSSLAVQDEFQLDYCSDCRSTDPASEGPMMVRWGDVHYKTPQVPVNCPTLDELLGRAGIGLDLIQQNWLGFARRGSSVVTIHAEAEGRKYNGWFDGVCARMRECGIEFVPLRKILDLGKAAKKHGLPERNLTLKEIPGRAGKVAHVEPK